MNTIEQEYIDNITRALENRMSFFEQCEQEQTTCYRLFHGAVEGWPSVTIDRYGETLLFQTWRAELTHDLVLKISDIIEDNLRHQFYSLWCDRRNRGKVQRHILKETPPEIVMATELGLHYRVDPIHRGIDPLLFLDFRAGRRKVRSEAAGKKVLNLFSYTCGIGVAAAAGGAKEVLNVDFANHALEIGMANAQQNGFPNTQFQILQEDAMLILRQFSGLGIRGKAAKRSFTPRSARLFDIVVLDPPRYAKSPFGTVDTVHDYQSMCKPAILCTKTNGNMLVTNNVASVDQSMWIESIHKCAAKAGRCVRNVEFIAPERDFPTLDGNHPLKMAWLTIE